MIMDEARVKHFQNVVLITDKGRSLKADLAVPCTGLKVNSLAYEKGLGRLDFKYVFIFTKSCLRL